MAMCLLPNFGLYIGTKGILRQEQALEGSTFGNIGDPLTTTDELTMGLLWLMFFVDSLIYGFILWYLDNVKPGPYGQAKPVYFLFLVSFQMNY